MPLFIKRPVAIEAFQILRDYSSINAPKWFQQAISDGVVDVKIYGSDVSVHIRTLEGRLTAGINDWIIKGVVGEIYPCRDDIFKMSYEPVGEEYFDKGDEVVVRRGVYQEPKELTVGSENTKHQRFLGELYT